MENSAWNRALQTLSPGKQPDLVLGQKFRKLLLHKPGDFYKKQRDSEKVNEVFSTLVVQLPSSFFGGYFCISHSVSPKHSSSELDGIQNMCAIMLPTIVIVTMS